MREIPTIGELRQRVTLEQRLEQRTQRGGTTSAPQVIARRLPARVRQKPGVAPVHLGGQTDRRHEYDVVIRFREGLTRQQLQVRYHAPGGDRLLEAVSITDVAGGRRFQQLLCREATA